MTTIAPAPTAAQSLERSDLSLLRRLASEAQAVAATRRNLDLDTDPSTIALSAQRIATAAAKFEAILEAVRATGAGVRNESLFAAAISGDDGNLY